MPVTLLEFPPEILVRIALHLTTPELGLLRRSCKQVENALFDSFAKEFFTKRQFMIEHESLEALRGIANHPGLASRLTEVIFGTQALSADLQLRSKRMTSGHVSRHILFNTGMARDILIEIFSKLPNLRTVGLRDYNGTGRARDGSKARWRSWGWSMGASIHNEIPDVRFSLLLSALGAAKATPASIEVFLRRVPHLSCDAFELPHGSLGQDIIPVLRSFRTLMFAVSFNAVDLGVPMDSSSGAPWRHYDEKGYEQAHLQRFLHYTSSLESLRVNFEPDQFLGARFVRWLAQSPAEYVEPQTMTTLPIPPVALTHLTILELGMVNVAGIDLIRTLTRFNLHTFSLWKMVLQSPGPNSISKDCWAEFLDQLAESLSSTNRLRTIMIGHVTQCYFPGPHNWLTGPKVSFVRENTAVHEKANAEKLDIVRFQGKFETQSAKEWLKELSARTFVPGIHTTPEPDFLTDELDSGESDEDNDQVEDEESGDDGEEE